MAASPDLPDHSPSRGLSGPLTVWIAAGVAVAIALVAVLVQAGMPPLPGRGGWSLPTATLAAAGRVLGGLASLVTLGGLVRATLLTPKGDATPLRLRPGVRMAQFAARIWIVVALVMVPLSAADALAIDVSFVLPRMQDYLVGTQVSGSWLLAAVLVAVASVAMAVGRRMGTGLIALYLAGFAVVPPIVTGHVSVGAGHDWGTDLAMLGSVAAVAFGAIAVAVLIGADDLLPGVQRRARSWLTVAAAVALVLRPVVGIFELAGFLPWQDPYGWVVLTACVLLAAALVSARLRSAWPAAAIGVLVTGTAAAAETIVPPRYAVPQSAQVNYLGFHLDQAPDLATLLLPGRPNVLFVLIAVAALAAYGWGLLRLRRAGIAWPWHRTLCWAVGWLLVLGMTGTGLWAYSSVMFSYHMIVHMTINMIAPIFLVLAGPITLILRASKASRPGALPSLRDLVTELMQHPVLARLMHPLLIWVIFVGSFYGLYLTDLFGELMRYHWGHQFMTLHFLIVGSLFYGQVIGVDKPAKPLPHLAKLGLMMAAMPFHAFFAVALLSSPPIGLEFYQSIAVPWMAAPDALQIDQDLGGQITWATGEVPMLIVVIALLAQWFTDDTREARRKDRAADAGLDNSADAYNEMLAELAKRDEANRQREGR
ncbi:cytochrome c oxidase assembly protein [Parenemella sanctibonifatiensis]|uniref:cytochrome c oxidase assembly protein n=1 Tax=Parenemella sanctibonifatiensis TaxID=2016505 RepID=UPI0011862994|nr:cytochrome c oxidase assembly protein [Parenemella sanctibonifatiensis]